MKVGLTFKKDDYVFYLKKKLWFDRIADCWLVLDGWDRGQLADWELLAVRSVAW
jgi:hypothetical protein